jgi:hypothetical protein
MPPRLTRSSSSPQSSSPQSSSPQSSSPESSRPGREAGPALEPLSLFNPFGSAFDYMADAFQRTILFWDVMRERGNQAVEHAEAGKPPVLSFRNELVMDGRTLERPCNYLLLRILPSPDTCVRIDPAKRPFIIVDPPGGA